MHEKQKLPYSLLLDPVTDMAAAYTMNHRLITETASEKLVQYARDNTGQVAAFERKLHEPTSNWRPLPAWASDDILDRLQIIWIKRPDGDAPAEDWLSIPAK